MTKIPLVSVIVPVFNESTAFLDESLTSLMNQSFCDFECIVVDDSTHLESAIACESICDRDSRFRYVHPEYRLGLASSLNLAISMARGQLIARFDSDDICFPERLAVQVEFMGKNLDVGILGCGIQIIDENGFTTGVRYYPQSFLAIARKLQFTNSLAHPTVMYRASILRSYGGYDPSFKYSEDLDLWLRWLNKGIIFANLSDILLKYRQPLTNRHFNHWLFNLRARIRNFALTFIFYRLIGILFIAIWAVLPLPVKQVVYRLLVISRL